MKPKPISIANGQEGSPVRDHLTEGDVLLTRAEAAAYLRRSVPTLERWAAVGEGPPCRMVGGRALYQLVGLRRFAGVEIKAA